MGRSICRWVLRTFIILYVIAIFILLVGTFGWFGQERDPLSGIFLLPLGLPWNLFLDGLGDSLRPWAAAAAPLLNIVILRFLCVRLSV
ncbi:hypothetical protein SAMN05421759_10512 [Roseivivax lentus]|uniref:Uncharacterized protein n=1 Tax=Roseivivax lentus TaxID=633194 RepID=A0A1N7MMX3_9RHOB|nr:hypothetical protein SAMN05421759_10512 [Roseivivax lentus]